MVESTHSILKEIRSVREAAYALEVKISEIYGKWPGVDEHLSYSPPSDLNYYGHSTAQSRQSHYPLEFLQSALSQGYSVFETEPTMIPSNGSSAHWVDHTTHAGASLGSSIQTRSDVYLAQPEPRAEDISAEIVPSGGPIDPKLVQPDMRKQMYAALGNPTPQRQPVVSFNHEPIMPAGLDPLHVPNTTPMSFNESCDEMTMMMSKSNDDYIQRASARLDDSIMDISEPFFPDVCGASCKIDEPVQAAEDIGEQLDARDANYWDIADAQRSFRMKRGDPMARASRLPLKDYLGLSRTEYLEARVSRAKVN